MNAPSDISRHSLRLAALRAELARRGLDGFVVPLTDEHLSEYVGAYAQRLEWLTGFGGSAGTAVVLTDPGTSGDVAQGAAIFVDGRYTLQVRDQVDGALYAYENVPATSPREWLALHAPGARIGHDPWLHTRSWAEATARALAASGGELVALDNNPIDAVWSDRPASSLAPLRVHPSELAGEDSQSKRDAIAATLVEQGCDTVVIAALDSIAWAFNIRGADVARTPVALAFALVHADASADLFVAPEKLSEAVLAHLGPQVRCHPREAFLPALAALSGKRVMADPESCVAAIFAALADTGAEVVEARDPCVLPKALKNPAEQAGHRAAQALDGAAMARFLHWLSEEAPQGHLTEIAAADHLEALRREAGAIDLSFDTISGAGANGAVVHYRVSAETNRRLDPGAVYLVDSGGQYPAGTTDITRTVWIGPGEPPAEVKDRFTRVLKGHIALAMAVFPKGTAGSQLDTLARQHLWAAGLDYAHGTGHGVGAFLAVHEGPQRVAKAAGGQAGTGQNLLPGMILSDEPGYYKAGAYGIRIENLLLVERREIAGGEGEWMGFETLTLAPIDTALVEPALLSPAELAWWNAYHARVLATIGPLVEAPVRAWLKKACAPLPRAQ